MLTRWPRRKRLNGSLGAVLALFVHAYVTSITPGPNDLMLLASADRLASTQRR